MRVETLRPGADTPVEASVVPAAFWVAHPYVRCKIAYFTGQPAN